jgi:hypothetical protein
MRDDSDEEIKGSWKFYTKVNLVSSQTELIKKNNVHFFFIKPRFD